MWPFRKKPNPAPLHTTARRRAQRSSTADLQYWAAITLPAIQGQLNADTTDSLKDAELYAASLYEIVHELKRRKDISDSPALLP